MASDLKPPAPARRFRLPLHIHISTLFFLLVLIAGGSIAWVSYVRSAEMLERAAGDLLIRISRQTVAEIESLMQPVNASVRLLALQPVARATTLADRRSGLPAFREALRAAESVSAYYIGYGDGDFFMLLRLLSDADRRQLAAPPGAAYVIQSIAGGEGHFIFLDEGLAELRNDPRPDYPGSYDPRRRSWYIQALGSAEPIQTAPYLFASTRKPGVTVARLADTGRAVVGADIRLATLDETLRRQRITPGSQLVLFDDDLRVVAYTEPDWLAAAINGTETERPKVTSLSGGALAALVQRVPRAEGGGRSAAHRLQRRRS